MTTNKMIRQLQTLKKSVLEDGVIDWDETEKLCQAIRPLSVRKGFIFENYERLLEKCRKDMKITSEESRELAIQLDFLCSLCAYKRLTFWLYTAIIALVIACSIAMFQGISSATDTSAFRNPMVEDIPEIP